MQAIIATAENSAAARSKAPFPALPYPRISCGGERIVHPSYYLIGSAFALRPESRPQLSHRPHGMRSKAGFPAINKRAWLTYLGRIQIRDFPVVEPTTKESRFPALHNRIEKSRFSETPIRATDKTDKSTSAFSLSTGEGTRQNCQKVLSSVVSVTAGATSENFTCLPRPFRYTRNVPETTDAGFSSLNNRSAHAAHSGFFVRIAFAHLFYGWALVGASSDAPVPSVAGLLTPPCARPPHLAVDGGPSNKPKEPAMRAIAPARSEQTSFPNTLTQIVAEALRDAAMAATPNDALDIAGGALLRISYLAQHAEVSHG